MFLNFLLALLISLVVTLAIELFVAHLFGFRTKNERKTIILATFITFFAMNIIIQMIGNFGSWFYENSFEYYVFVTMLEGYVVIVEYCTIKYVYEKKFGKKKILWLAISMNLASYLVGLFVVSPLLKLLLEVNI